MNDESRLKAEREFLGEYGGGLSVEEFLGHSSSGGGGSFLSGDWKEKHGEILVWLHKQHLIYPVWFHNFYKSITVKDREKGGEKSLVISTRWNCRDYRPELGPKRADKLLRKARYRQDDGSREHPPVLCPFCKLEDWLAVEVRAGRIGFTQSVFRFTDAKGQKAVVLHAGGIVGFYNDKVSDEEKEALRREKISLQDAWKEKTTVRLNYLVVVIPYADPEEGPKKYFAPDGLGDALKTTIRKEMDRRPKQRDLGNPLLHPYPFKFKYDKNAASFGDRYDVDPIEEQPSPEVLAEIGGDKLDLSDELEPGNCRELRTLFEAHALIDMPFDLFFAEAEREGLMEADDRRAKRPETKKAEPEPERFRCDACDSDGLTADRNTTCSACGAHYDADGKLDRLPCLDCKKPVEMLPEDGEYACAACGAKHSLRMETQNPGNEEEEWIKPIWTKVEAKPAAKRRGRKPAAATAGE
jgi:hypothetical protein